MKRVLLRKAAAILTAVFITSAATFGAEKPWEDQLCEMVHFIIHISSINAINGLNLSREQAVKLKALARQVERAGAKPPKYDRKLCEGLNEVRQTYLDLREVLLKNEAVSDEMKTRILKARAKETEVIRASLVVKPSPLDYGRCTRCHVSPERFSRGPRRKDYSKLAEMDPSTLAQSGGDKKGMFYAHMEGLLTRPGILAVAKLAPQVDAVLTDAQKDIMDNFSCCLIPPKALSDPVRAGQASASEADLKLLRNVRACPETFWPAAKKKVLDMMARYEKMKYPGIGEAEQNAHRERLAAVLEKARNMSDVEFEMSKESLCAELKSGRPQESLDERKRRFMRAYFLLAPGAAEIYDAVMKRPEVGIGAKGRVCE